MPYKDHEMTLAYAKEYSKKNKDKVSDYVKKYNKAQSLAKKMLIELHKGEYDLILAGEKKKLGINSRTGINDETI